MVRGKFHIPIETHYSYFEEYRKHSKSKSREELEKYINKPKHKEYLKPIVELLVKINDEIKKLRFEFGGKKLDFKEWLKKVEPKSIANLSEADFNQIREKYQELTQLIFDRDLCLMENYYRNWNRKHESIVEDISDTKARETWWSIKERLNIILSRNLFLRDLQKLPNKHELLEFLIESDKNSALIESLKVSYPSIMLKKITRAKAESLLSHNLFLLSEHLDSVKKHIENPELINEIINDVRHNIIQLNTARVKYLSTEDSGPHSDSRNW